MSRKLYKHTGTALLRAAAASRSHLPTWWPDPADADGCLKWLAHVWSRPDLAGPIRQANPALDLSVDALRAGSAAPGKQLRRATMATARYLLRATGRPTPFGLFAGVAPARLGPSATVRWGSGHRAVARVDMMWLGDVIGRLEACPVLLERLDVVLNNLAARRGGRLQVPHGGPHGASIRYTSVVRALQDRAAAPIRFGTVVDTLTDTFPGTDAARVRGMLTELVQQGFLLTCLRAPMTVTDPLGHLIEQLHKVEASTVEGAAAVLRDLEAVAAAVRYHNDTPGQGQARPREALTRQLRTMSDAGRAPLAVDLLLDATVEIPVSVAREMEAAAGALLRLTRRPAGHGVWHDYQTVFWERYGTGTLVPLREVLDPAAGIGFPAEYPGSTMAPPAQQMSRRDERLLALAWQAVTDGSREIVLTDDTIDTLIDGQALAPEPPHVEMCGRVHAPSIEALNRGDFNLTVTPARSAGTLTSRFTPTASGSGLADVYRTVPAGTDKAIRAQLSFPPLYPHTENVCRIPAYVGHVIPLGEHRGPDEAVIELDDLAVTATHGRLYLVSVSRRRVIEPQVFHAMALEKQPPPLARFLAHLPRAFTASWTGFDWGPEALRLPYLPRVRYQRTILAPARWYLTRTDLPTTGDPSAWQQALDQWRKRWACPDTVELRTDDRTLPLTLSEPLHAAILRAHLDQREEAALTEAAPDDSLGWIGQHVHEIALPLVTTRPPTPDPLTGRPLPTLVNSALGHMPGSPDARWLYAKIYTHPERIDEIITGHLPRLLDALPGEPAWWFLRYRSPYETDHLRLRLRIPSTGQYATFAAAIAQWAEQLRGGSLASRLVLDTYSPESGRYGQGAALEAAEAAFAADSLTVAAGLRHVPGTLVHPTALVALGMVDIARGFLGADAAMDWLANQPAPTAAADRTVADQALRLAQLDAPLDLPGWKSEITDTWTRRTAALAHYRSQLPDSADTSAILESLLHMHHNRALGLDRPGEKVCRHFARQAARAWQAHR
ncbi:lantibiotic dehydratase [Streptomyces sp. NPDC002133]|uniref:lantibiotic dehydratase n=1 Tax=Streptomyces sp. NPDC002133 TaxID=3154409 RepID=UPI003333CD9F